VWLAVAATSVAISLGYLSWRPAPDLRRTYRMGFRSSPPRNFVDANGRLSGPIFDLIDEAAHRAGVKLEWVYSPEGPESALSGSVDLWPLFDDLPERSRFYITQPYAETSVSLITKQADRKLEISDTNGRVIGVTGGLSLLIAQKHLPHAQRETLPDLASLVSAVCKGVISAGVISESIFYASELQKPKGCELRIIPIPGARFVSGIGAAPHNPKAARIADLIRDQIGSLLKDGTFSTISLK
jgi:ABC-type amino acid transport substrate-binding protein